MSASILYKNGIELELGRPWFIAKYTPYNRNYHACAPALIFLVPTKRIASKLFLRHNHIVNTVQAFFIGYNSCWNQNKYQHMFYNYFWQIGKISPLIGWQESFPSLMDPSELAVLEAAKIPIISRIFSIIMPVPCISICKIVRYF